MNNEQFQKMYEQAQKQQHEESVILREKLNKATVRAQETQNIIDTEPKRQYSIIVALDENGGFAKDKGIPWHYPDDFKWFKGKTQEQICVMGKNTYVDINNRLGEKAKESVLPNRTCFVVSTTLQQSEVNNATVIPNLLSIEKTLIDLPLDKKAFFIGGGKIFHDAISLVDEVIVTHIDKDYDCDQLFPTKYLLAHFDVAGAQQIETSPELRFVTYKRTQKGP